MSSLLKHLYPPSHDCTYISVCFKTHFSTATQKVQSINISSTGAQGAFKCSDVTVAYTDANTDREDTHVDEKLMLGSQSSILESVTQENIQHI